MRHRADADVRPRRAARERPAPRRGAGAGPRSWTRQVAARARGAAYAGEADPYKKPREARTDDEDDDASRSTPTPTRTRDRPRPGRRRQARGHHLARRGRPGPPAGRHPQGRPRRHARPDGHRRAGARRQPGHPAARPPDADRQGVRRHDPARASPRSPTTPRARSPRPPRPPTLDDEPRSGRRWREFVGDIEQVPTVGLGDQGRRQARLPAGARRRGGRAARRGRSRSTSSRCTGRARRASCSTSTSRVRCSSGTYIRAIARDLGAALGVGGHLTALRRTAVGPFDLAAARTLERARPTTSRCCRSPRPRGPPSRPSTSTTRRPRDVRVGRRLDLALAGD